MNILEALLHAVKFIPRRIVDQSISPAISARASFTELTSTKDRIDFICHLNRQKIDICHYFNLYFLYLLIYKKPSCVNFKFLYIVHIPDFFDITISNFQKFVLL